MCTFPTVAAVGSRDELKAKALISQWADASNATSYGSYDEVLHDPRVRAVYIPLPTTLHVQWVQKAASMGKHILLEKPIAVSSEDTDTILQACSASGVQLFDGTMWMWHPRTIAIKDILQTEQIGSVKDVAATFTFAAPPGFESNIRLRKDCDPLGCLGDLGWYCIRAILWAYGFEVPVSVAAYPGFIKNNEGVPISVGGTLIFKDGRRGNFRCSFDTALTQHLEICGSKGTILIDDFVIPRSETKAEFVVTRDHRLGELDTWDATVRDTHAVQTHKPQEVIMWEGFARSIQSVDEESGRHWAQVAALTQKVVCLIADSMNNGCSCETMSKI